MEQTSSQNRQPELTRRPVALVIVEGWGVSPHKDGNAVALAHTPNIDDLLEKYPNSKLAAAGASVGLAPDQPGNTEVGHLNLGSGRIVETDVARIANSLRSGTFFENEVLKGAFAAARESSSAVHLIGLLSDGDVHSSSPNLYALLSMAKNQGVSDIFVHAILDGRNVEPRTADTYCEVLEIKLAEIGAGKIATLCGRHYAMDRDENWDRTARVCSMLMNGIGERASDAVNAIRGSFLRGISDEFIQPIILENEIHEPVGLIKEGDTVVFFNHRADRMKQLAQKLAVETLKADGTSKFKAVCLTEYARDFDLPVAFRQEIGGNILAQVFAERNIRNCRVSETANQRNVVFFNGGVSFEFPCEERLTINTPKNQSTELQPELNCFKVTDAFLRATETIDYDFYVIDLSAAEFVARTGNLAKTMESFSFIDTCIGGIVERIRELDGVTIITSDHGNCEEMTNLLNGEPHNLPTANPVPFILVDEKLRGVSLRNSGALADVAPTILDLFGIEIPPEMTGSSLIGE